MDSIHVKEKKKFNIKDYISLIETISKVEYKNIASNYLIEYNEIVNIGIQVVHYLENLNNSYITTAIKWAIRNEVRRRWRWYGAKLSKHDRNMLFVKEGEEANELILREAIYKTILSIDDMQDNENPLTIKDKNRNPEEKVIFREMANAIKESMCTLTPRERELIENRFYQDKKLKDMSEEFKISQSRISSLILIALNKMKLELMKKNIL